MIVVARALPRTLAAGFHGWCDHRLKSCDGGSIPLREIVFFKLYLNAKDNRNDKYYIRSKEIGL